MEVGSWTGRPDHTGSEGLGQELKFYAKGNAKSFDETTHGKFLIRYQVYITSVLSLRWGKRVAFPLFPLRTLFYFIDNSSWHLDVFENNESKENYQCMPHFLTGQFLASLPVPVQSHCSAVVFILQARADAACRTGKRCVTETGLRRDGKQGTGDRAAKAVSAFLLFLPSQAPHESVPAWVLVLFFSCSPCGRAAGGLPQR